MFFAESVKIALSNLLLHKLRTSLTMLGMIFGVAAVLSMLSIGAGAGREALSLIQKMGLRNVLIRAKAFEEEELGIIRQDSPGLTRHDVRALRQVLPDKTRINAKKEHKTYQIASAVGRADSRVLGVNAGYPLAANLELVEGSFFLPADGLKHRQVCVLGKTARRKLFGLNPALGEPVKIDALWFTVVGVLADQLLEKDEFEGVKIESVNNDIYVPLETLLAKYERKPVENELDEIIVQLPQDQDLSEQAAVISGMVASTHRNIDDFSIVVPERLLEQSRQTQRIFNLVMGAIASISLLVGGIGIMNIMLASVLERTNEIGPAPCGRRPAPRHQPAVSAGSPDHQPERRRPGRPAGLLHLQPGLHLRRLADDDHRRVRPAGGRRVGNRRTGIRNLPRPKGFPCLSHRSPPV